MVGDETRELTLNRRARSGLSDNGSSTKASGGIFSGGKGSSNFNRRSKCDRSGGDDNLSGSLTADGGDGLSNSAGGGYGSLLIKC